MILELKFSCSPVLDHFWSMFCSSYLESPDLIVSRCYTKSRIWCNIYLRWGQGIQAFNNLLFSDYQSQWYLKKWYICLLQLATVLMILLIRVDTNRLVWNFDEIDTRISFGVGIMVSGRVCSLSTWFSNFTDGNSFFCNFLRFKIFTLFIVCLIIGNLQNFCFVH